MSVDGSSTLDPRALAEAIGRAAATEGFQVAVAESLTGGSVTSLLAAAPDASTWLRGGVVAYMAAVKHEVLDVRPGPVVSEAAAGDMARGVARLLGADMGLSITGVGGPAAQDGQPPGTVWTGVYHRGRIDTRLWHLDGPPDEIVLKASAALLGCAVEAVSGQSADLASG